MAASAPSQESFKPKNKLKRHEAYLKLKKAKESAKRDARFRRRREEDRNPRLRSERRARNVPVTIEKKRMWDEVNDDEEGDGIGLSVDIASLKRQKLDETPDEETGPGTLTEANLKQVDAQTEALMDGEGDDHVSLDSFFQDDDDEDEGNMLSPEKELKDSKATKEDTDEESDELGSLLDDSDSESSEPTKDTNGSKSSKRIAPHNTTDRAASPTASATSTNLSLIPDALAAKFPSIFNPPDTPPKLLITTSLNGTVHAQAMILTTLFPNSTYVPRSRHKHNSHKFSLRQISQFAHNRNYTALLVLEEDRKRPSGLTIIHLPSGPTFHFTITNWIEGKKLPGHGRPTEHNPELILNNFRTPLGVLTASLFRTLFPPAPEIRGRQVVTLHNQRDYIFVRRHRYVFRDRRPTEKVAAGIEDEKSQAKGADTKKSSALEDIRTGLQELGPRFTLKLRRIDRGIQRASGQEWEWKSRMEKTRTKFQL